MFVALDIIFKERSDDDDDDDENLLNLDWLFDLQDPAGEMVNLVTVRRNDLFKIWLTVYFLFVRPMHP